MSTPTYTYTPPAEDNNWSSNTSLMLLDSANSMSDAITGNMIQMSNIGLTFINENTTLAQAEQDNVKLLMEGGQANAFDGNDSDNDPRIWGNSSKDPNTDSNDVNMVQTDVNNCTSYYKVILSIVQAIISSFTNSFKQIQQNQMQLFTFMNGANQQQDYVSSLLGSSLV
ncbi:hypothetical protein [Simkania sp.]|uniref:hypothetical protein n=1 Tax=Simkania sp. TaxID=34094 RepID=UPI003B51F2BA